MTLRAVGAAENDPSPDIGAAARIPNPALEKLGFLLGEWQTTGTHPLTPGQVLRGRASFSWHEGGAFLIMRSEVDHPDFPSGVAVVGSDDGQGEFAMLWFDERGTSRNYDVTVSEGEMAWRRDDPKIAQTIVLQREGRDRLASKGRVSEGGQPWSDDLSQIYTRLPCGPHDDPPAAAHR